MKNLNLRIERGSKKVMGGQVIATLFGPYFNEITIRFQEVDEDRYDRYRQTCPYPVLSMDPLYKGDYNLEISRLYRGNGTKFVGHFSRPEAGKSLLKQFRAIPKGIKVVIFEDDIGFGGQIRRVKKILARMGVVVVDVFTLYDNTDMKDEVLDARDFILNSPYGGLVVENEETGERKRVPYLFPLVDVKERCSITDEIEFSMKAWILNMNNAKNEADFSFCKRMLEACYAELR